MSGVRGKGSRRPSGTPSVAALSRDSALRLSRRAAVLAPLALGGCGLWDNWFGAKEVILPGKREPVMPGREGLQVDPAAPKTVVLPPPVLNAAWPQAGGNPAHLMGHLASAQRLSEAWAASIGAGGGYRRKIMAQPVVADGIVFTMDSDAVVTAFDAATGARRWRQDTAGKKDRSTNVGGGLCYDQGVLYAVNGLAELVAFDAATGHEKWRRSIGAPGRSAPTAADGRLFLTTIVDKLLAFAAADGRPLWEHQAPNANTSLLGQPAPAYADGLVVAGFGSGELAVLRADSGAVAWTDSLAAPGGLSGVSDISAIRGLPVISQGRVFAIGLADLMLSNDLRSGRRLWEREVGGEDSLWVAGDWLFVVSVDQRLAAVDARDGRVAWVTDLPRFENPKKQEGALTWFGPVLVADRLIVAGTSKDALAVSPYTGAILGRQKLSGAASLGPVVANGTVFIVSDDGRLLALR